MVSAKPGLVQTEPHNSHSAVVCLQTMRRQFVEIKSVNQQALRSLHWARALIVRQRTQLINALRSLLAEFGVSIARGVA